MEVEVATIFDCCQNEDCETYQVEDRDWLGVVVDDIAYFPCPVCQTVWEKGNFGGWSTFWDSIDTDTDN